MPNRLAQESSPYLLQHAGNPVDWFPWSEEALELARTQDRPIFLSIGYSACHWCHVMEHESFENEQIAGILNDNFISIKVDREERPDIDQIYMNAVMALQQGQGGWPLNVFLTPEQDVFFGGTYWPPSTKVGRPGFDHVLHSVLDAYTNRRDQVAEQSQQITEWLNKAEKSDQALTLDRALLQNAASVLHRNFDANNGGFGGAPKFPHCMDLALLVRLAKTHGGSESAEPNSEQMLEMVRVSLKKMAYGGIFDHLAGGFARYSVDDHWLVPHFEKMLYDNSLLAGVYLDMHRVTGDRFYAMIAEKTLAYLMNYLTDEAGGFHSTEDADSEGVEGKFYVWSEQEVMEVLGEETGESFCQLYNISERGNFEGHNILHMTQSYQQFADQKSIDKKQLRDQMRDARLKLLEVRDRRIRPGKDDKVLVNWNGLGISAMAKAARQLDDAKYSQAASNSAEFIWSQMRDETGRLLHTWRNGVAKISGFLDDYANLLVAFVDLYEAAYDQKWLDRAAEIAEQMIAHFHAPDGGFFFTSDDQQALIARPRSFQDSSVPSGNAMAAFGLIRLGRMLGQADWIAIGKSTIEAASALIQRSPLASGQMLIAIDELITESQELVVVTTNLEERKVVISAFRQAALQRASLICKVFSEDCSLSDKIPVLADKQTISGQTTLYICSNFSCQEPIIGLEPAVEKIKQMATLDKTSSSVS